MTDIFGKEYTDNFFNTYIRMSDMDFDSWYDSLMEVHDMDVMIKEGKIRKEKEKENEERFLRKM